MSKSYVVWGKKEQRVVVGKKERERRIANTLLALCAFEG